MQSTVVANQPYDEAVDVSDDEPVTPPKKVAPVSAGQPNKNSFVRPKIMSVVKTETNSDEEPLDLDEAPKPKLAQITSENENKPETDIQPSTSAAQENQSEESDEDDEDEEEEYEDDPQSGNVEGAYDPADYEHLAVSAEVKELFSYITRYTPQTIELEHKIKPFIPVYIPAVGDIDAFIKVLRPDGKPETLGLTVLDEPSAKQSDPSVLDLQLRAVSKQANVKSVIVKTLENAEKNPKEIDNWIKNISDLHKSKPPPNVHYSKTMPDIESLMQEWDPEFEELLKEVGLPSADLDCDLEKYVEIITSLLDIPVHKSKIQSLHVLFTLYSEFKNSQHFRQLAENNMIDNSDKTAAGVERLVIQ